MRPLIRVAVRWTSRQKRVNDACVARFSGESLYNLQAMADLDGSPLVAMKGPQDKPV